ncbi:class I SAM-dependent methyltransferase [Georgenia sp. 10Sc9-8]|uniref:Class I SAM-dependent methyltransferase n=1 Tax=Georgenia halotolerans TaxID=3028317 RepID=A0ABT5U130_9MICO|nr:class I SAM-dependent methyltransferase [Georgenia halotolerans]
MSGRRAAWRAVYELLGARVREPEWAFMNYGYAPAGGPVLKLAPGDEPDRLCIQLYDHVLAGADLMDQDVLEVGSGRGGGASYVARYVRPRSVTDLDFSRSAVEPCSRHRRAPGLRFVHGDAQAMPFPDASFDAVINVESSHCYPSMETFLAEVARVLRPGGRLFFADLRSAEDVPRLRDQLQGSGLTLRREQDITAEVLRAMQLDNARKLGLVDAWIPRPFHRVFRPFAGVEGTRNFAGLGSGRLRYLSAQLARAR